MSEQRHVQRAQDGSVIVEIVESERTACACCSTLPCQRSDSARTRAAQEQEALSLATAADGFYERLQRWYQIWRRR